MMNSQPLNQNGNNSKNKFATKKEKNIGQVIKPPKSTFTKVSKIRPSPTKSSIVLQKNLKVTVVHKTDEFVTKDDQRFWKILLADNTGQIYARVFDDHVGDILDKMQVGRTYIIESPVICKYDPNYVVKSHPHGSQLVLRHGDKIKPLKSTIQNCRTYIPFEFTDIQSIPTLAKNIAVDLIGFVSEIHWDIDPTAGWELDGNEYKELPPRQFILSDSLHDDQGTKLRCTVWGNQSLKITAVGDVVILQGVKVSQLYWNQTGVNVGNTSEIHFINTRFDLWKLSSSMEKFYWKLFPGEKKSLEVLEEEPVSRTQDYKKRSHGSLTLARSQKRKRNKTPDASIKGKKRFDANDLTTGNNGFPESPSTSTDFDKEDLMTIEVIPSEKFMDIEDKIKHPYGVYRMRSKKRGIALIVNNLNFSEHSLSSKDRDGSYSDKYYMEELFAQLDFEIMTYDDLSIDKFADCIQLFISRLQAFNAEAMVVVIMSHGRSNFVQMIDGNFINVWNDVVYKFKDELCPFLAGKPKFFIFQACQGIGPTENDVDVMESKDCVMTDTLVSFPALPGSLAARNEFTGSWFIKELTNVFMKNAHSNHLLELLQKLQRAMVVQYKSQQCFWIPFLFDKPLFFNPGLASKQDVN